MCEREREGGEKERQKVKFSRSAIEVKRPFQFGLSGKKMNLAYFFVRAAGFARQD